MYTIMVVEDELLEQQFLYTIIRSYVSVHDQIVLCQTGKEAIEQAKQNKPDICVMDIQLPELDGLEALKEIKFFLPHMHTIIISASSDFTLMQKAIQLKVHAYLLKPIQSQELEEEMNTIFTLYEQLPKLENNKMMNENLDRQHVIEESLRFIHDNYQDKLSLQMVSSHIYMNPQYFSRVFKKEVGISYTKYVNSLKIKHACKLLETTNFPAYRISLECGFNDASYFNRVFYKEMKLTPIEYKKNIRKHKSFLSFQK